MMKALFLIGFLLHASHARDICDDIEFPCDDGHGCVVKGWWCDGSKDCNDGSDEIHCSPGKGNCSNLHFICHDGTCIPMSGRCDTVPSCKDFSDELNCSKTTVNRTITVTPEADHSGDHRTTEAIARVVPEQPKDKVALNEPHVPQLLKRVSATHENIFQNMTLQRDNAVRCILSRMAGSGWGEETPRAIVSLYLSNPGFFNNQTNPNNTIIVKNLHIQLAMELLRNNTRTMSLSALSHYINALVATCSDPRNFHGVDLVSILRQRTDAVDSNATVNPFVYLTLCIVGESTTSYLEKARNVLSTSAVSLKRPDLQALAVLAAMCMVDDQRNRDYFVSLAMHSLLQNTEDAVRSNVYTTSLLAQALETILPPDSQWAPLKTELVEFVLQQQDNDGCFGDNLANYYAMPVLSGNPLVSLKRGCNAASTGFTALEVLRKNADISSITVKFSLYLGDKIDLSHTVSVTVPLGTSIFDVMRLAAQENAVFDFKYEVSKGYPTVFSIGLQPNDAEQAKYWFLYKAAPERLVPVTSDITKITVNHGDHYLYWYKSSF